jgi:hypothetical protein
VAAVFLLVPAAQAMAASEMHIEIVGSGSGEVSSAAGTPPLACTGPPASGTCDNEFEAFIELNAFPDPGSEIADWEVTGSGVTISPCGEEKASLCAVIDFAEGSTTVTVTFNEASGPPEFDLGIDTSGGTGTGSVKCEVGAGPEEPCAASYAEGTELTLVPAPGAHSEFAGFENGTGSASACTGTSPCSFILSADSEVDAPFDLIPRSLTIDLGGSGSGEVLCEVNGVGPPAPCSAQYGEGTELTLVPSPDAGSEFAGFSNGSGSASACTGTSPCTFDLEADSEVDADFELEEHELSVNLNGTGEGMVESSPTGIECEPDCEAEYTHGTTVTLSQAPEAGSQFEGWSGCDEEIAGDCIVEVNGDAEVTATFGLEGLFTLTLTKNGTGTGTVTSSPAGIDCGATCSAQYAEGTEVTLSAVSGPNTKAVAWTGCASNPTPSECKVTMSAAKAVTATFDLEKRALSVTKNGTGTGTVTSSPAGIDCGATCSAEYNHGTEVTLSATPSAGSTLTGWTGCASNPSPSQCKVTMSAAKGVTATFDIVKHALTLTKNGSGTGTVTSSPAGIDCGATCSAQYAEGTEVTLSATPGANSTLSGWTGCASNPTPAQCKVTMSAAKAVSATFALEKRELSVSKSGTGMGVVSSSPAGIVCAFACEAEFDHGTVVTLNAAPNGGSQFVEWSGACSGTGACQVTMNAAKSVDAKFDLIQRTLTIAKAGSGSGSVSCDGGPCAPTYPSGTKVTLSATPDSSSTFAGFSGGGCAGTGECKVTLNADTTVTATFEAKPSGGGGGGSGGSTQPPALGPTPAPDGGAALGRCVKGANASYRKALEAAKEKQGKAKARAIKAARRKKAKAAARCRARFHKRGGGVR